MRRGHELLALSLSEGGTPVTVEVHGPDGDYRMRAGYIMGCDGAHSLVRKQAGIGFPGVTSSETGRIGRVFLPRSRSRRAATRRRCRVGKRGSRSAS